MKPLPEYVQRFLDERNQLVVQIEEHAIRPRPKERPVTSKQIHRTILEGEIEHSDCEEFPDRPYDKYAVALYFGDEKRTLKLILTVNWETWGCQVETLWTYKGRPKPPRPSAKRRKKV